MRARLTMAALSGAILLAGCAVIPPAPPPVRTQVAPGAELVGRSIRVETSSGQASTLHFAPGGAVHATFGERQAAGRWEVADGRLCFTWPGAPRECWPYRGALPRGETVSLTSDRGNVVRVTLQ